MENNNIILALFFTRGVSLETWLNTGLFDREKLIYEEHLRLRNLKLVYWFTYGCRDNELAEKLHSVKRLHNSIHVIPMPKFFIGGIGALLYSFIIPFLQRKCLKQVDIFKTNQMNGSWSAVLAKWLYRRPLILRTGYTLSLLEKRLKNRKYRLFIFRLIEWLSYKNASCSVVTSEKDKRYILKVHRFAQQKIIIIPNFIDTNLFKPKKIEKYFDRILFVGRLAEEKNLFNLISAMARTNFTLDIYGKGNIQEDLERHAREQCAKVNFMGTVSNNELPEILNQYKYYVLSSYFEGMPKTLLEAMACGLICIGTDVDGINEIIDNGVTGLLTNGVGWKSIYETMEMVRSTSKEELDIISLNGRNYALNKLA